MSGTNNPFGNSNNYQKQQQNYGNQNQNNGYNFRRTDTWDG